MVDVSNKAPTARTATAEAWVRLPPEARAALEAGTNAKGDPLIVARLAGLAASKRTAELITLCHPLPVTGAEVRVTLEPAGVRVKATVRTTGPTGVEMEALTAVTVAALNVYDMLKAASKALEITGIRLLAKTGGKSGDYEAPSRAPWP
ncbi:cyclic pyranopterin monophosphate synthase MoaC [Deinococcus malanensis]|nr:cyclic pyranopterin monophosphate synthase MoaC [Deinococcus malanensis]